MKNVAMLVFATLLLCGLAVRAAEKVEVSVLRTERTSLDLRRSDNIAITVEAICYGLNGEIRADDCDKAKERYRKAVAVLLSKGHAQIMPLTEGETRNDIALSVEVSTIHLAYFIRAFKPREGIEFQLAIPLRYEEAERLPQKLEEATRLLLLVRGVLGEPVENAGRK